MKNSKKKTNDEYVVVTSVNVYKATYIIHNNDLKNIFKVGSEPIQLYADHAVRESMITPFSEEFLGELNMESMTMTEAEMLELYDKEDWRGLDMKPSEKIKIVRSLAE